MDFRVKTVFFPPWSVIQSVFVLQKTEFLPLMSVPFFWVRHQMVEYTPQRAPLFQFLLLQTTLYMVGRMIFHVAVSPHTFQKGCYQKDIN